MRQFTTPRFLRPFALLFLMLVSFTGFAQFEIPEKPDDATQRSVRVYDYIDLLSEADYQYLNEKLLRYADTTSTQIVIAIIKSTQGEDISLLGAKWGEKWGVGQDGKDNGIFITLAHGDREIDINTGYGIEGILTDRMAEKVINQRMIPEFKLGYFYQGLNRGVDGIIQVLAGEFQETKVVEPNSDNVELVVILVLAFFFVFLMIIIGLSIKGGGGSSSTGSLSDVVTYSNVGTTTSSYSSSSSSSSWSSGSSGSSFGGGSFGGGGASGSW